MKNDAVIDLALEMLLAVMDGTKMDDIAVMMNEQMVKYEIMDSDVFELVDEREIERMVREDTMVYMTPALYAAAKMLTIDEVYEPNIAGYYIDSKTSEEWKVMETGELIILES